MALRGATEAQDSLDERLGKLKAPTNTNTFNILNIQEQTANARERFTDAVLCIATGSAERVFSMIFQRKSYIIYSMIGSY